MSTLPRSPIPRSASGLELRFATLLFGAFAGALAACRDPAATSHDASADAGADAARIFARPPAPPPTDATDGGLLARKLPRIEYRGGPFLRHPKLVTITFTKDDPKVVARLEQFGSTILRSDWWRAVSDGYCAGNECIGEGSSALPVHLDDALPVEMRDDDIDALLLRTAKAGRLGAVDANTLWLVYLPKGVNLSDPTTPHYCTGTVRGFHRSVEIDGRRIPFAVMPRCSDEAQLTGTASHEILEAATNAFPVEHGFSFVGGSPQSGFTAAGIEPVDPCGLVTMDGHWAMESGFVVHRAWSNREAALAHDPCVPSRAGRPYVMLVPREPTLRLAKAGDTVTVELDASTASGLSSWAISAFDLSGHQDHERYVELSLDKATIRAGESTKLTITSIKSNPHQREIVALVSTVGVDSHMWPLLVMMR